MSTFGSQQEVKEYGPKIIYTGIENFRVRNVNLNDEEAKKLYGDSAKTDVKYVGEAEVDGKQAPQLMLKFICDNDPEEGEAKIFVEPTFWITKAPHVAQNGKIKYINAFGDTIWLPKEEADKKLSEYRIQGAKGEYVFNGEGMRVAMRGEDDLIAFLRNLLNLPSLNTVLENNRNKDEAKSMFSIADWNTMFNGNFTAIKTIAKGSINKVGLLLGAKRVEDKVYQDVYTRGSLRQWVKGSNKENKFDYLTRQVIQSQQAGSYSKTDFGDLSTCELNPYAADAAPTPKTEIQGGFGGTATEEDTSTVFDADAAESYFSEDAGAGV